MGDEDFDIMPLSVNDDDYDYGDFNPLTDDPYELYEPKRWPEWKDFLEWLKRMFGELLNWLFGD